MYDLANLPTAAVADLIEQGFIQFGEVPSTRRTKVEMELSKRIAQRKKKAVEKPKPKPKGKQATMRAKKDASKK